MALRDPTSCWPPPLSWLLRQNSLLFLEFYINGITLSALFFWFLSLSIIISRFACDDRPLPRVSE